jgi:hypothetical protein
VRIRRNSQGLTGEDLGLVQFVPLVRPVMGAIAAQDQYGQRP